jgi:hypothetical protein
MIPVGQGQGFVAELKAQSFFSPNSGFTLAPVVGYAIGF